MLVVLSPAKSLDLSPQKKVTNFSQPEFLDQAEALVKKLRKMSTKKLGELMGISQKLSELNSTRYADWSLPFTQKNAKQAILTFSGDVYTGLDVTTFKARDFTYAQKHLRILSGLYGLLRPLDLMQAYRLEMGTKLATRKGKTLYKFWGETITLALNKELEQHQKKTLINLASNEYFKSIQPKSLAGDIITPIFREIKAGKSKTIALFTKQARGKMAAWMIRDRVGTLAKLKKFKLDGYEFQKEESTEKQLVFSRPQPPPVNAG